MLIEYLTFEVGSCKSCCNIWAPFSILIKSHLQQTPLEIPCTPAMFKTQEGLLSEAAFWACRAQDSLQRNWFPDPIQVARYQQYEQVNIYLSNFYIFLQGLFSYQTWNGMDGFWQNGVVLETMANAMHYLNFTR